MVGNTALTGKSWADRIFDFIVYLVVLIVIVVTIYPFLNVLAISLNDSVDSVRGGITIYPREFTWDNYLKIFTFSGLVTGFKISALRTVAGTLLGLISASMLAFTVSRPDFQGRKFVSTFLAMTMYISGGIIPVYMLVKDLGMMNYLAVYRVPGLG
ncbi:sugar ABC transporter permease, partial [Paenibacillus riograndensis]